MFESHAGDLDHTLFVKFALPYIRVISKRVRDKLKERKVPLVPMVNYITLLSPHLNNNDSLIRITCYTGHIRQRRSLCARRARSISLRSDWTRLDDQAEHGKTRLRRDAHSPGQSRPVRFVREQRGARQAHQGHVAKVRSS